MDSASAGASQFEQLSRCNVGQITEKQKKKGRKRMVSNHVFAVRVPREHVAQQFIATGGGQ